MSEANPRKRQRTAANIKPTMNDAKNDNEAMGHLIDKKEDKMGKLISQLQEVNSMENAKLKQKNQEMTVKLENLEQQIDEYSLTETSLRLTISHHDNQRKFVNNKLAEMVSISINYEHKVRDLEKELATCKTYLKKMKEEESQRKAAEEISNKLWAEVDAGTAKINELESASEDSKKQIKDLKAQLANKEENEAKLRSEMEDDKAVIKRLKEKAEGRDRRIKDLENEVEANKKIAADLESKLEKMEEHHKAGLNLFLS